MAKPSILAELPRHTRDAVAYYWQTRTHQVEKQRKAGATDQGLRGAVTGGAHMNRGECRKLGFDNLNPIIWHKISNASYEVSNGSKFLGKPYEPNAIIKNDIEFILMQRKPGGYRKPTEEQRRLSLIPKDKFDKWFQQFWTITGASTKEHPAPFPLELASRLVQMFSFTGDTVPDPFCGTATTMLAALKHGRNSIGVELDTEYCKLAAARLMNENTSLFGQQRLEIELKPHVAITAASVLNESGPAYKAAKTEKPTTAKARPKTGKYDKIKN